MIIYKTMIEYLEIILMFILNPFILIPFIIFINLSIYIIHY